MVHPKPPNIRSDEGYLDQADNLLKKKVLLNILTDDDADCIKSFVSEVAATRNISSARRYKLTTTLANSRKWLKTPFRKMSTSDLFKGIDAIQNDEGLTQNNIGDYIRALQQISLWLIENEMAAPGLKVEKIKKIAPPAYTDDNTDIIEADLYPDNKPQQTDLNSELSDLKGPNSETKCLVTLAKIFHKNKKFDLARAIAEYCLDDPVYQKTCLDILMRCAYYQKDFPRSLEYADKLLEMDPLNINYMTNKNQILEKINEMITAS